MPLVEFTKDTAENTAGQRRHLHESEVEALKGSVLALGDLEAGTPAVESTAAVVPETAVHPRPRRRGAR